MKKIKILLAEDHTIVRKGLVALLNEEGNFVVAAEAEDGLSAVKKALLVKPDVAVLDIGMSNLNGLEAARQIKKNLPDTKVLMLTMHDSEDYIIEALKIGVSGYLVKKSAPDDLINAINAAIKNETFLSPSVSTKVINKLVNQANSPNIEGGKFATLTTREREVLQLIAEGATNKDIAEKLNISSKTVKVHRSNMMGKLDLHNTAEITQYAIQRGLVHVNVL